MSTTNLMLIEEIHALLEQAYFGRINNLPNSIFSAQEALKLSKEIDDKALIGKSLNQLSLYYMITSNFEESNKKSKEAIICFETLNDRQGVADANFNIGSVYYKTNNYHLGLVHLIEALKVYREFKDYHKQSKVEKAVGTIYGYIGDENNAFLSFKRAIKIARKIGDKNSESNVFNALSGLMIKKGKLGIAKNMIEHSIALKKETKDVRGYGFAIYGRGKIFAEQGDYVNAELDYLDAIKTHSEMGENMGLSMAYRKLGVMHSYLNNYDKADELLNISLKLCLDYNMSMFTIKNYYALYLIAKKREKNIDALSYLEKYITEKESVINNQTLKVVEDYELINKTNLLESEAILQKERQQIILKESRAEQEALKKKQAFLSIMSHEIRTPLNAITTTISLLKDSISDENMELFSSLQFASANLIMIVNDILDFTKLDTNKAIIQRHSINFNLLCTNIYNLHKTQALKKGLNLLLNNTIPDNNYLIDQTKITQILSNLINNAIKFTEHGDVEFETKLVASNTKFDTILFSIKDSGEGILKKNTEYIFSSFFQIKPITTRIQGGTGLGLPIVKKLVELHGGEIHVESEINEGSTFYFSLQLEKTESAIIEKQVVFNALNNKLALVAEDTAINALLLEKVLSKWGIMVEHVKNGELAVASAKNKKYDFILMDIHMPVMNGFEASEQIKSTQNINKNTPIFAVTADVLTNEVKAYSQLFDGILWKPLEIEKMYDTITKTMSSISKKSIV